MAFTAGPAFMVVKSRLVTTATGIAAKSMKGFLLPRCEIMLSEL